MTLFRNTNTANFQNQKSNPTLLRHHQHRQKNPRVMVILPSDDPPSPRGLLGRKPRPTSSTLKAVTIRMTVANTLDLEEARKRPNPKRRLLAGTMFRIRTRIPPLPQQSRRAVIRDEPHNPWSKPKGQSNLRKALPTSQHPKSLKPSAKLQHQEH